MYCFINARTRIDDMEWKAPGVERIHNRPLELSTSCHRQVPRASRVLHCSERSSDQRLQQHKLLTFPRRLNRRRKTLHPRCSSTLAPMGSSAQFNPNKTIRRRRILQGTVLSSIQLSNGSKLLNGVKTILASIPTVLS
jgi:hypothetical protein